MSYSANVDELRSGRRVDGSHGTKKEFQPLGATRDQSRHAEVMITHVHTDERQERSAISRLSLTTNLTTLSSALKRFVPTNESYPTFPSSK